MMQEGHAPMRRNLPEVLHSVTYSCNGFRSEALPIMKRDVGSYPEATLFPSWILRRK